MNINMPSQTMTPFALAQERARFMSAVYRWMTAGILITAFVATYMANNPEMILQVIESRGIFYGLVFAQLGAVMFLSLAIQRISPFTATAVFLGYSALTGVTTSIIFLIYTRDSIASVFFTTAIAFAGLSAFGSITKRDLGPIGSFCGMALFGLVGWGLLSLFFPSLMGEGSQMAYSLIGVIVFSGLTAYDTQKIKAMGLGAVEGSDEARRGAIYGALILYLDFINLFMNLLRLMGNRRR